MKKTAFFIALAVLISVFSINSYSGSYERFLNHSVSPQYKFRAQRIVRKLTKENKKKLVFIESIIKNFPYTEYKVLKKNYWTGRLHVVRGNIIAAQHILLRNKKDIDKLLEKIAKDYHQRSMKILNAGSLSISSFHMKAMEGKSIELSNKLKINKNRMKVAVNRIRKAESFMHNSNYMQAIIQFRNAKAMSIVILNDLADSRERILIKQRYKLDLADNRNNKHGVYVD